MEKYVIDKVIGEGTYGIVYRATEKVSSDQVAIKKFKTAQDEQLSKREIQACSMLSHPYIVSYRHNFRHEGLLHLVFDHVPDGMNKLLARNRRGIKPVQAQRFIYQLCQALQYCHASRVIHRDVKPDNILIDDKGDIRLCDFGVARTIQFEGDPLSDYVATRWYRPPEQELRMDRYSFDADMWSVGCVLMELLTGRPLFPGNTQIDQLNLIQKLLGPLPQPLASRLPRGVAVVKSATNSFEELLGDRELPDGTLDFLYYTIHLDPRQRLSAAASLRHPFLKPLYDEEQRERRHRQQEEKQRRSKQRLVGSTDSEDGIEEEIPGVTRSVAEAKVSSPRNTPSKKAGPRAVGFKGVADNDDDAKPTKVSPRRVCTPNRSESKATPGKHHRFGGGFHADNNPADCDGDDIQEIIEMDELSLAEPVSPVPRGNAARQAHSQEKSQVSPSSKTRFTGAKRSDGRHDPSGEHHECYEDDFES